MIVYLYDSSISYPYSFIFDIQSMIITPSPKENEINEIPCYLYPYGFLFGTNIIIARIIFYLNLWDTTTTVVTDIGFPTTYNVIPNTN